MTALEGRVHSALSREQAVDEIFDDLGLLLRRTLVEKLPGGRAEALAPRLNAVERRLEDRLKPTGGDVHAALEALVDVASRSVFGQALAAAELFMHLTAREAGEVARALTGRKRIEVALDTSVAMPMLCAKLDGGASGWVTSDIALELHEALRQRGITMVVPNLYIEEMAAHLVRAAEGYRDIVGEDPALAGSTNFFVAHYHAASRSRSVAPTKEGFDELLQGLGLPTGWKSLNFLVLRRKIELELKHHFARYDVGVSRVTFTEAMPLPAEPARAPAVLDHDRRVVHWLDERSKDSTDGLVLCSQDRWLLQASADPEWLPIEPVALLDVVRLVRSEERVTPLASLRELAESLDSESLKRAATVWDFLAEFEGARLADHTLLRRAKEFKEAWLTSKWAHEPPHAAAWTRFKSGLSLEG